FFSSRRRHTRSDRDWSSDVCSSDLFIATRWRQRSNSSAEWTTHLRCAGTDKRPRKSSLRWNSGARLRRCWQRSSRTFWLCPSRRSEERRVGKECRAEWWADEEKERK